LDIGVATTAAPAEAEPGSLVAAPAAPGGRFSDLFEPGEASAKAGSLALRPAGGGWVALAGVGDGDPDGVRMAAAAGARAAAGRGLRLVWDFDPALALAPEEQVRAVVEGAVLGAHDPARWKSGDARPRLNELVIASAPPGADAVAGRAEVVARWTNRARELVDAPPNELTPSALARAAEELLAPFGVLVETLPADGFGALAAVGGGSANPPCLIVLRQDADGDALGLVGKAMTFDSGGFFLKSQDDIVRQKADMGGGAAVIGAVGAIAELGLPLAVVAAVPAAENMLSGASYRPGDIVRTASGLTVEVTNPDAEGRLVMADALWFVRGEGAARIVDVATLTGAMRAGVGDLYAGVFANDDAWRAEVVDAGNASGDHAWPWPLHARYRRLLDSPLADLRNTAGRPFGYAIVAATFLERFAGDLPWAHVDIYSNAYLDEDRDYLGRGATGAGVRMLVELATRLSAA